MKKFPGMQEIVNNTLCSRFDMCQVGSLTDPQAGEPLRKRLEVHTTSEDPQCKLHAIACVLEHICVGRLEDRPLLFRTLFPNVRNSILSSLQDRLPECYCMVKGFLHL